MSWSINVSGHPEKVVEKLKARAGDFSGDSREEYEAALPHLVALAELNVVCPDYPPNAIQVEASGHAWRQGGELKYSQVTVTIRHVGEVA